MNNIEKNINKFDVEAEIKNIVEQLTAYKNECRGVVIGLSGGKDSTTVTMLAKKVWGNNIFAVLLPNGEQSDIKDSIDIATKLGIQYKIVNIETIYNSLIYNVEHRIIEVERENHFGEKMVEKEYAENCPQISAKAKTNISPRIRMTVLYAIAQTLGYRVIGTGNLSEAYVGWCTKWGDCAYDINPIGNYTCSEVIQIGKALANEFGLDTCYIEKTPNDGLSGKSDEDNFGFSYSDLDNYIKKNYSLVSDEAQQKIEKMHTSTQHKREMPKVVTRCSII